MIAMAYGNAYVAQVAIGGNKVQTVKAFVEAEAWAGPSLLIAYSPCIAHGIDMETSMTHQKDAVDSGYWPLFRFHPRHAGVGERPFHLDSKAPRLPLTDFTNQELRFSALARSRPEEAERLGELSQHDVEERRRVYEQLAEVEHEQREGPDDDA